MPGRTPARTAHPAHHLPSPTPRTMQPPSAAETAEVSAAISQLYDPMSGEQARAAANTYLMAFAGEARSWAVAGQLLADPANDQTKRFFGAQLLHNKARRHWRTLPPASQTSLYRMLVGVLQSEARAPTPSFARVVLERTCLVVAAVAVHAAEGARALVAEAAALPAAGPAGANVALRVLAALPTEATDAAVSSAERDALSHALRGSLPAALGVAAAALAAAPRGETALAAMAVVEAWAKAGGVGLGLTVVADDYPSLLAALVAALGDAADLSAAAAAARCFEELLYVTEYPRSAKRAQAADGLLTALVTSLPATLSAAAAAGDAEAAHRLVACFVEFVRAEAPQLVAPAAGEAALASWDLLLLCTHSLPPSASSLTLDAWLELADTEVPSRHPSLRAPMFARLLAALAGRAAYPASFETWDDVEDLEEDEFLVFRGVKGGAGGGMTDVLVACFGALRCAYVETLCATVVAPAASWQQAEAALCLLSAVARNVCGNWDRAGGRALDAVPPPTHADPAGAADAADAVRAAGSLLREAWPR